MTIAFIGFGAVAPVFAREMAERGATIRAYDVLLDRDGGLEVLRKRAAGPVEFRALGEAVDGAACVLSTVTTQAAIAAAYAARPFLKSGQIYLDLNSTAPSVKQTLETIIQPSGADFVEGAILGAVGASGAATRILTGGSKGRKAAEALALLGLNVSFYSLEIGKASLFKMLRSVFSKGLEALILELRVAARRAGIEEDVWADVRDFMTETSFERAASNWIQTHPGACERRFHELAQVTATMREIGLYPIMALAAETFFERSRALGLDKQLAGRPPAEAVVEMLERRLSW